MSLQLQIEWSVGKFIFSWSDEFCPPMLLWSSFNRVFPVLFRKKSNFWKTALKSLPKTTTAEIITAFADLVKVAAKIKSFNFWNWRGGSTNQCCNWCVREMRIHRSETFTTTRSESEIWGRILHFFNFWEYMRKKETVWKFNFFCIAIPFLFFSICTFVDKLCFV